MLQLVGVPPQEVVLLLLPSLPPLVAVSVLYQEYLQLWSRRPPSPVFTSQVRPVVLSRVQAQSVAPVPKVADAGSSVPLLAILVKSNPAAPPPILVSAPAVAAASRP